MSLASSLRDVATRSPNQPALYLERRMLTYAELNSEAQQLALRLLGSGLRPGDRVALHMYNGAELVVGYFGCFYAGAIAVPVNTRMKAAEIEYVLEHSGSSIYLGQSELFQEISESRLRFPTIRLKGEAP